MSTLSMNYTSYVTPLVASTIQKRVSYQAPSIERLMQSNGRPQKVKAGSTIFLEGDPADVLYHVVSGVVRCCQITPDGRRQISRFLTEGDEMALTAFDAYGYTAEAVSDVELIRCTRGAFNKAMQEDAELRDSVFDLMATALNTTRSQMVLLGKLSASERAATFLLEMADRFQDRDGGIQLSMTRQDIADYLGMTLETVSRMFNKFKKEGIISMPTPDHIQVSDLDELELLAAA